MAKKTLTFKKNTNNNVKQFKPTKKKKDKSKNVKTLKIKSRPKKYGLRSLNFGNIFSLSNARRENKNFSTSFVYGDTSVDLKSGLQGNNVKLNYKINSKNFNISGTASLNSRTFYELQKMFEHLVSNVRNLGG